MSIMFSDKVLHFRRRGIFQSVPTNKVFGHFVLLGVAGLAINNRHRPAAINSRAAAVCLGHRVGGRGGGGYWEGVSKGSWVGKAK